MEQFKLYISEIDGAFYITFHYENGVKVTLSPMSVAQLDWLSKELYSHKEKYLDNSREV